MNAEAPLEENEFPTPDTLNVFLLVILAGAYGVILWAASLINQIWFSAIAAFLFAAIMTPIYSLLHEAEHGLFHSNRR